jgi:hypothetical protein
MRCAANFHDAALEQRLVAGVVIADQLAGPRPQKIPSVGATAAIRKVVDHDRQLVVFGAAITPQVSSVRATQPGFEHGHRRLIRLQHRTGEQCRFHRLNQRGERDTTGTDPLRQRRTRQRHPGASKDALLAVEGHVVMVVRRTPDYAVKPSTTR